MKAIIQTKYGNETTLRLKDVSQPINLNDDALLVKVHVANLSSGDQHINTLDVNPFLKVILQLIFGVGKPRNPIRGISGAGEVVSVGHNVTKFKVGDRVNFIDSFKASSMATFKVIKEKAIIASFDDSIDYALAAPIAFGAMTADFFINQRTIQPHANVLIYGASGSVGTYAVSLAKLYGAKVTAVASSRHYEKLKPLQAHQWIDYQKPEFNQLKDKFDVIFDAVGKLSKKHKQRLLKPKGKFYSVQSMTKESSSRLKVLNDLLKQGTLITIIDQLYPMMSFQEAHRHLYQGHKTGHVLLSIDASDDNKKEKRK